MQSINPVLSQKKNVVPKKKDDFVNSKAPTLPRIRNPRTKTVKFPITRQERKEFRRNALAARMGRTQTEYNSDILERAVQEYDRCWEIEYKDTGRYLTVKTTKAVNKRIEELMLFWGTSKREAVHRLMICTLLRGVR
ncbi:hypothetical protein D3C74_49120 [compost metagenome]